MMTIGFEKDCRKNWYDCFDHYWWCPLSIWSHKRDVYHPIQLLQYKVYKHIDRYYWILVIKQREKDEKPYKSEQTFDTLSLAQVAAEKDWERIITENMRIVPIGG